MERTITAIYEGGYLRPIQSLDLPEHQPVQIRIVEPERGAPSKWSRTEYARALRVLQRHGLLDKMPQPNGRRRISEKRRRALARTLSAGKPLSEIVIEERDEKA
ncbi:MAG: DUF104 domain-containing protein [Chloroflexi bacterium]|nr:DUF104 domain-containing protein [Chloroflexota bacterium]